MMDYIAKDLRDQIYEIARHRCEYCQIDQEITGAQMSLDHIIPTSRIIRIDESVSCMCMVQ